MNLVHDLSIRTKMIAAFTIVLACTAGIGLFATHELEAVNATAEDVRSN